MKTKQRERKKTVYSVDGKSQRNHTREAKKNNDVDYVVLMWMLACGPHVHRIGDDARNVVNFCRDFFYSTLSLTRNGSRVYLSVVFGIYCVFRICVTLHHVFSSRLRTQITLFLFNSHQSTDWFFNLASSILNEVNKRICVCRSPSHTPYRFLIFPSYVTTVCYTLHILPWLQVQFKQRHTHELAQTLTQNCTQCESEWVNEWLTEWETVCDSTVSMM